MAQHVLSHISNVSAEHSSWLRGLDFYKDELSIQRHRLAEISQKNTASEIKSQVEHYQNQFIVQEQALDQLKSDIGKHVQHMESDVDTHAQHLSNSTLAEHDKMRDRFVMFEKLFNEMRHEYNRFLVKTM